MSILSMVGLALLLLGLVSSLTRWGGPGRAYLLNLFGAIPLGVDDALHGIYWAAAIFFAIAVFDATRLFRLYARTKSEAR